MRGRGRPIVKHMNTVWSEVIPTPSPCRIWKLPPQKINVKTKARFARLVWHLAWKKIWSVFTTPPVPYEASVGKNISMKARLRRLSGPRLICFVRYFVTFFAKNTLMAVVLILMRSFVLFFNTVQIAKACVFHASDCCRTHQITAFYAQFCAPGCCIPPTYWFTAKWPLFS